MTSPSSGGLSRSSGASSRATSKSISESQRVSDCKSIVCHARHDTKVGFRFIRFSKLSYVQRKSFTRHLLNLVPSIVTLRYYIFGPPQAPKNSKFIFFSQFGSIFQQGESSSFRQYFFKFLERTTQIWKFIPGFPEKKIIPGFSRKKTGYNKKRV